MHAPRSFDDLEVMTTLMKGKESAKVPARHEWTIEVSCGFSDASKRGLGSTKRTGKDGKIYIRIGVLSVHEGEEYSSNWKKFGNVVDALEE